jgi:hypothetical protein
MENECGANGRTEQTAAIFVEMPMPHILPLRDVDPSVDVISYAQVRQSAALFPPLVS